MSRGVTRTCLLAPVCSVEDYSWLPASAPPSRLLESELCLATSPLATPDLQEGKVFVQMAENPKKAAEAAVEKRGLLQHQHHQGASLLGPPTSCFCAGAHPRSTFQPQWRCASPVQTQGYGSLVATLSVLGLTIAVIKEKVVE